MPFSLGGHANCGSRLAAELDASGAAVGAAATIAIVVSRAAAPACAGRAADAVGLTVSTIAVSISRTSAGADDGLGRLFHKLRGLCRRRCDDEHE